MTATSSSPRAHKSAGQRFVEADLLHYAFRDLSLHEIHSVGQASSDLRACAKAELRRRTHQKLRPYFLDVRQFIDILERSEAWLTGTPILNIINDEDCLPTWFVPENGRPFGNKWYNDLAVYVPELQYEHMVDLLRTAGYTVFKHIHALDTSNGTSSVSAKADITFTRSLSPVGPEVTICVQLRCLRQPHGRQTADSQAEDELVNLYETVVMNRLTHDRLICHFPQWTCAKESVQISYLRSWKPFLNYFNNWQPFLGLMEAWKSEGREYQRRELCARDGSRTPDSQNEGSVRRLLRGQAIQTLLS